MENQTLLWIANSFIYLGIYFLLFFVSKFLFDWRYRKFSPNKELTDKDNFSFALLNFGYFVAVLVIFCGVVQGPVHALWIDLFLIGFYVTLGFGLLFLSSYINTLFLYPKNLHLLKEIVRDENSGIGVVEAASYIGSAILIYGAISGNASISIETDGLWYFILQGLATLLPLWLLGQFLMVLFIKIVVRFSPYKIYRELEQDNVAVGIVFAGVILAFSLLFTGAIKGDFIDWFTTLENTLYHLGLGMLLLPVSRFITDKIILPKASLTKEIIGQEVPNNGAALLEAFSYVSSAFVIIWIL